RGLFFQRACQRLRRARLRASSGTAPVCRCGDPFLMSQIESLQFQLRHIAALDALQQSERFGHADDETVGMLREQAQRFVAEHLEELAARGDLEGCRLENGRVLLPSGTRAAWQQWCELGFPTLSLPPEIDGLGLPHCVQSAVQEITDGANLAFGMLAINMRCASLALAASGDASQIEAWLPGLVS